MEEITRAALEGLAALKRRGIIPSIRPCCGRTYCVCDHRPRTRTLRDHAPDPDAYDTATRAIDATGTAVRLRVLTPGPPQPPCDDTHTCRCPTCVQTRLSIEPKGAGPAAFRVIRRAA